MSLPKPNLDDKTFAQIAEEARALIPGRTPEWTDHNVHDPGITFIELFAWLAEIQQYRLNRTSAASYDRFLSLAGVTRHRQQAAEVLLELEPDDVTRPILVPANTRVVPVGKEEVPFETVRDVFLTPSQTVRDAPLTPTQLVPGEPRTTAPVRVVTNSGGRTIDQTRAEDHDAGHYYAFGALPKQGDALQLGFNQWFEGPEIHLTVTLFEGDLPARPILSREARGFVPSARLRWEYRAGSGWKSLEVIDDGTLHLSRSGMVILRRPGTRQDENGDFWIRAAVESGHYEIPPRIFSVRTDSIWARQVETIVNEDLRSGLGTPNQRLRLRKYPVLIDPEVTGERFQTGEVLDWQALVMRLARPDELHEAQQNAIRSVRDVLVQLRSEVADILSTSELVDRSKPKFRKPKAIEQYSLAQAFDELLDKHDFYNSEKFPGFGVPPEFQELAAGQPQACANPDLIRKFNRLLLRWIFRDQMPSDRVEIQVGRPVVNVEDEPTSWSPWEQVADFSRSGPRDRHYVLDAESGEILFGNGLNGRVPKQTEHIRARFYRHTQAEKGNLPAGPTGQQWLIALPPEALLLASADESTPQGAAAPPPSASVRLRANSYEPAVGGAKSESLDEAKLRARAYFRKSSRALTANDYESLATQTPGLRMARAKALPNRNPRLRSVHFPGDVTVLVLPAAPPPVAGVAVVPAEPSDGFLQTVRNFLDAKRLVTTNVHVIGPRFVTVSVNGRVFLKKGASAKHTLSQTEDALRQFLDPVRGGPQPGAGWAFGRAVFPSEIYQLLMKIPAVDYVVGIALNGRKPDTALELRDNELPSSGPHKLELIPFEQRSQLAGAGQREVDGGCGCA